MTLTKPGIITVAADGSAGSRRALVWALQEANHHHCSVELVCAYTPTETESGGQARERAAETIHATMDDLTEGHAVRSAVSWKAVEGAPAEVLLRESERSRLLVMGSHGVSGLRHSALGSVTDLCARMAGCPVVVVPSHAATVPLSDELSATGAED